MKYGFADLLGIALGVVLSILFTTHNAAAEAVMPAYASRVAAGCGSSPMYVPDNEFGWVDLTSFPLDRFNPDPVWSGDSEFGAYFKMINLDEAGPFPDREITGFYTSTLAYRCQSGIWKRESQSIFAEMQLIDSTSCSSNLGCPGPSTTKLFLSIASRFSMDGQDLENTTGTREDNEIIWEYSPDGPNLLPAKQTSNYRMEFTGPRLAARINSTQRYERYWTGMSESGVQQFPDKTFRERVTTNDHSVVRIFTPDLGTAASVFRETTHSRRSVLRFRQPTVTRNGAVRQIKLVNTVDQRKIVKEIGLAVPLLETNSALEQTYFPSGRQLLETYRFDETAGLPNGRVILNVEHRLVKYDTSTNNPRSLGGSYSTVSDQSPTPRSGSFNIVWNQDGTLSTTITRPRRENYQLIFESVTTHPLRNALWGWPALPE